MKPSQPSVRQRTNPRHFRRSGFRGLAHRRRRPRHI